MAASRSPTVRSEPAPLDEYTIAGLHAVATRALAEGDDYSCQLLREQLKDEEFERPAKNADPDSPDAD